MRVADLVHRQDPSNDPPRQNRHYHRSSEIIESAEPSPQTDSSVPLAWKRALPEPLSQSASEKVHYPSSFLVQRGDWVVRLREGDLSAIPHQDITDIWDGPFQILEGPDPKNGHVQLHFPSESKAIRTTDTRRLRIVHPVPQMPSRGIFHPEKGTSIYVDKIDPKPKSKKAKTMFIVDRLRGQRMLPGGKLEYLVHWAGWPSEDDTWESSRGLPTSVLDEYEKANPTCIRHRRPTQTPNSGRRKPLLPLNESNQGAIAIVTTSEEEETLPVLGLKRTRKRKIAVAAVPSAAGIGDGRPLAGPYKDRRRRTRNSGFIEDLGA
ncbi:hypothetical protein FGG08_007160 [Glutinoglossum americanum]|uniref:Chromo domain-containing protein n=1 Tax=Glutinoglossum americanum TaxID=1670608 RepID=A0A9P8L0B7_9PEZI|nr:hypothetical protein FGG08_007160 [Glutinoglossum americanum]